jgi:DNA-binding transcriptional LysR family regulator
MEAVRYPEATETRELRYFVTVAEELHFGRAAQRLGIAQPPLSRAIKQLERRLGVALFERSSRQVTLTAAGEVLLAEGRIALDAVLAATRRTQRAGSPRIILATKAGGDASLLPEILAEYETQPGAVPVEFAFAGAERSAMLRDGRADVGFMHRPRNNLTGLDWEDLLTERQVVLLPGHHRLAGKDSVSMADLRGETMPRWPGTEGTGPVIRDTSQLMQLISLGRMVAVAGESVRDRMHAGMVAIPVPDAPPTTLVIAWPQRSRSLQVAAFVQAAVAVAARHHDLFQMVLARPAATGYWLALMSATNSRQAVAGKRWTWPWPCCLVSRMRIAPWALPTSTHDPPPSPL